MACSFCTGRSDALKVGRSELCPFADVLSTGFSPHFAIKNHEIRFAMSFHLEQLIEVDRITNVLEDVELKGEAVTRGRGRADLRLSSQWALCFCFLHAAEVGCRFG